MYVHYNTYLRWQLFVSPGPRERGCINDSLYVFQLCVQDVCAQIVMHTHLSILHWDMDNWTDEGLVGTEASRDITAPSTYWVVAVQDVWVLDGVYLHTGLWVKTYWII